MSMVYLTTPNYITLLFVTKVGVFMLMVRRCLDDHGRPRDEEDDQLQVLTLEAGSSRRVRTSEADRHDGFH